MLGERTLEKTEYKYRKGNADLEFLQTCRDNDLIPKFLNFRLYNQKLKSSELYRNMQKQLLDHEIKDKEKKLSMLEKSCKTLYSHLKDTTSILDFNHLWHLIDNVTTKQISRKGPDKGNGVVLLDKDDYITKVNTVLEDTSKFKKVVGEEPLKILSSGKKVKLRGLW